MLGKLAGLFSPGGAAGPLPVAPAPKEPLVLAPLVPCRLGTTCCAYDPLNRLLARGTCFGQVFLYGASFCLPLALEGRGPVTGLLFAAHKLLVVFARRVVEVFNLVTAASLCVREFPEHILCMAAPCGRNYVFCGTSSGKCLVLNLEQDVFVSSYAVLPEEAFGLRREPLVAVAIDPGDEAVLLLGYGKSGTLVEWHLREGRAGSRYQGPRGLEAAAFKRDGKLLAAGYRDGSVLLFSRAEPAKVFKVRRDAQVGFLSFADSVQVVFRRRVAPGGARAGLVGAAGQQRAARRGLHAALWRGGGRGGAERLASLPRLGPCGGRSRVRTVSRPQSAAGGGGAARLCRRDGLQDHGL